MQDTEARRRENRLIREEKAAFAVYIAYMCLSRHPFHTEHRSSCRGRPLYLSYQLATDLLQKLLTFDPAQAPRTLPTLTSPNKPA